MLNDIVKRYGIRGKGYRARNNELLKSVKAIHMLSAIAWGGGAFGMQALGILQRAIQEPAAAQIVGYCSWFVDTWVVMPGLFGCIFTGLFYSIFTSIGFFKFAWIGYKWLVTASACFWGLLFWSKLGDKLIAYFDTYGLASPLILVRGCILPENIWATLMQTGIILSMCLISVYRPVSFRISIFYTDKKHLAQRVSAIMRTDLAEKRSSPLDNQQVKTLYDNWLGEPFGPQSKKLLHMKFQDKSARLMKLKRAELYPPRTGLTPSG